GAPQSAPRAQERNRLDKVGFAGAVRPDQHDRPRPDPDFCGAVVAEIRQGQAADAGGGHERFICGKAGPYSSHTTKLLELTIAAWRSEPSGYCSAYQFRRTTDRRRRTPRKLPMQRTTEDVKEQLTSRLLEAIDQVRKDVTRVELWASALTGFSRPVPEYDLNGRPVWLPREQASLLKRDGLDPHRH